MDIKLGIISGKCDYMYNKLGIISGKFDYMYNKLGIITGKFDQMYIKLGIITGGGQWRKMAKNGEKWRKMAMANSAFSFVKFAIFRQFLILEFHI